jgi:hypothetical protein
VILFGCLALVGVACAFPSSRISNRWARDDGHRRSGPGGYRGGGRKEFASTSGLRNILMTSSLLAGRWGIDFVISLLFDESASA